MTDMQYNVCYRKETAVCNVESLKFIAITIRTDNKHEMHSLMFKVPNYFIS